MNPCDVSDEMVLCYLLGGYDAMQSKSGYSVLCVDHAATEGIRDLSGENGFPNQHVRKRMKNYLIAIAERGVAEREHD